MVIYEVNCLVDESIADAFREWLLPHVQAIEALEGFTASEVLNLIDDEQLAQRPNSRGISVRYTLKNREYLDQYLQKHAPAFRQEGIDRFGGQFTAYRRVLSDT